MSDQRGQGKRVVGFALATIAFVAYALLFGALLGEVTGDRGIAYGAASLTAVVGVIALAFRFFRTWTPESVAAFRSGVGTFARRAIIGTFILTGLFVVYLMARNN